MKTERGRFLALDTVIWQEVLTEGESLEMRSGTRSPVRSEKERNRVEVGPLREKGQPPFRTRSKSTDFEERVVTTLCHVWIESEPNLIG